MLSVNRVFNLEHTSHIAVLSDYGQATQHSLETVWRY